MRARLNRFVQNQSIDGTDVVVWYAAHFSHDQAERGGRRRTITWWGRISCPSNW